VLVFAAVLALALGCARDTRVLDGGMGNGGGNGGWGDDGSGWGDGSGSGAGSGGGSGSGSGGAGSGGGSGSGSGSGSGGIGGGAGGIGFNGPLGDVTSFFLRGMPSPPGYWVNSWPFRFRWSGPTRIQVFKCYAYQLDLRTIGGNAARVPAGASIEARLTDSAFGTTNGGSFFLDEGCRRATATVRFGPGESSKRVYYSRAMVVPSLVLRADARFQGWDLIGRYHIASEANPEFQLPICFNFEDLYGRPESDNDYNDAVVMAPASSLFATPDKRVEAYNNQRVTLRVWGTSACDSSVRIEHRNRAGQVVATRTVPSARAVAEVTFDMQYQDRLTVFFTAKGACASGEKASTDPAVRVANTCRRPADEGQRWN
jgi:hypothetical protein